MRCASDEDNKSKQISSDQLLWDTTCRRLSARKIRWMDSKDPLSYNKRIMETRQLADHFCRSLPCKINLRRNMQHGRIKVNDSDDCYEIWDRDNLTNWHEDLLSGLLQWERGICVNLATSGQARPYINAIAHETLDSQELADELLSSILVQQKKSWNRMDLTSFALHTVLMQRASWSWQGRLLKPVLHVQRQLH